MKAQEHIFRKALVTLMLGVYVFGMIKPVMPLVKDVLAHTFFKAGHMATVHYENGRYHLHMELNEEAKANDSKQTAVTNDENLANHIQSEELFFTPFTKQISEIHSPYINVTTDVLLPNPFQPPQARWINLF